MASIDFIEHIEAPDPTKLVGGREFVSPDGMHRITYHDKFEWANEAYGWRVSIYSEDRDVTAEFKSLLRFENGKGFKLPPFAPWSEDSRKIAFLTCENNPMLILDLTSSSVWKVGKGDVNGIAWSPKSDALLTAQRDGVIVSFGGKQIGFFGWQPHEKKQVVFWLNSGDHFISLAGDSSGKAVTARLHSGKDGRQLAANELELFGEQNDQRPVGLSWNSIYFDSDRSTVRFKIFRQAANSFEEIKDQWAGLRFSVS